MMTVFLTTGGVVLCYMTLCFFLSLVKKRNDIADVAWGIGFIVAAVVSLVAANNYAPRAQLVTLLVMAWGSRLAVHIHVRNRGKGEDPRYRKWREEWGGNFYLRSFLQVFLLQGFLLLTIATPVIAVNVSGATTLNWFDGVGALVWLTGFLFEAVGDWQLLRFIRNPANRGSLMTSGLWRYSRHPNYFGEVTLWWGIWLFALSTPYGWLSVIGPITITMLILKVSGIPMLEKKYENRPDFQEYKKRTSPFFPLPPRGRE
jgi:steroid 5-alpha reductase family enzyme